MNQHPMSPREAFALLGFHLTDTGGGCTALRRANPDGTFQLITLDEDPVAPTKWTDAVWVGTYRDETASPVESLHDFTLREVFMTLQLSARFDAAVQAKVDELNASGLEDGGMTECPDCDGKGMDDPRNDPTIACPRCQGTGEIEADTSEDAARQIVDALEAVQEQAAAQERPMRNRAMRDKLRSGEAIDLSATRIGDDQWRVPEYVDDVDYCDAKAEIWIWSIGRHKATGEMLAASDARFYQNPSYECLWLR